MPDPNQFGEPFDSFSVAMRLDGVEPPMQSADVTFTINIEPEDDLTSVESTTFRFDEDSHEAGREIELNISDSEVGQVCGE